MQIGSTEIVDTFAEAFDMAYSRLIVTAVDEHWLRSATHEFCGYGSSVIGCDAELAVESWLPADQTPDGRPGASILVFGFGAVGLGKALTSRVGQGLMTCPTTAVFDGIAESDQKIPLGKHLRFFGDGFQKSKVIDGNRFWRVPVMDGEFVVADTIHVQAGIGGGNLIIQGVDQLSTLTAARRAADAIQKSENVISPFAGGVVRSGSKVGSRYKSLRASTADRYCPTLRGRVETKLADGVHCAYELVIDGISFETVSEALKLAMNAAAGEGIVAISAGNYGGDLGKHHFHLKDLV